MVVSLCLFLPAPSQDMGIKWKLPTGLNEPTWPVEVIVVGLNYVVKLKTLIPLRQA